MGNASPRRNTRQRQVILEELRNVTSHPTAAQLYELARRRLPKLSLGTVYRNLELLTQDGTIRKLEISGTESRFDGNTAPHCHVRCIRCGRIDDVSDIPPLRVADRFKNLNGYDIIGHRLEFTGICPECQGPAKPPDDETPRSEGS